MEMSESIDGEDASVVAKRLAEKGLGGDSNEYADPAYLLRQKRRFSGEEPWCSANSGGVIHPSSVPEEWSHWKNVYIWHPLVPWDYEALENGTAIASWPCDISDRSGWKPPEGDTWADYVGLYQRRPARKWRRLVEEIGYDEMWEGDQFARWLEENIEAIVKTARSGQA
jgi:hypothetical protein